MMELYLVQHGEAAPEIEDPARTLTPRGRADVERVGRQASRAGVAVPVILHSGKLRARQTAEILASAFSPLPSVRETGGLSPNDDPSISANLAEAAAEPTMLVGHLPHLGRLASLLLVGSPDRDIVSFRMGAMVCLVREAGLWRLRWMITPGIAGG